MGRSPCCDKVGLKKGPWTPEEDQKLLAYIEEHGHGSWRALPAKAGLQRCGKSCRLRWTNYLRPDIKRGKFSMQEEQTIIQLHALLGNRWSAIATHLSKRTDNEIKNYWNTHLKKRLEKMGIDPVTHKPKNDALLSTTEGHSKNAANLSHMAQWESARLEAEARLVRESKLRSSSTTSASSPSSLSLDHHESSTHLGELYKDGMENSMPFTCSLHDLTMTTMPTTWGSASTTAAAHAHAHLAEVDGFTNLLLNTNSGTNRSLLPEDNGSSDSGSGGTNANLYEDSKNYWNNILNLMNYSSPSDSPMF